MSYPLSIEDELIIQNLEAANTAQNEITAISTSYTPPDTSREETASAIKKQHEDAYRQIKEAYQQFKAPETDINYFLVPKLERASGVAYPDGTIVLSDEGCVPLLEENAVLQHELHHQYVNHSKIISSDDKEVLASEAPMSVEQAYCFDQANEIGSKITELLTQRERYILLVRAIEKYKHLAQISLSPYQNDDNISKLMTALENNTTIKRKGNIVTFTHDKQLINIDLADKMPEALKHYISKTILLEVKDNPYSEFNGYWKKVNKGEINPLSDNPADMKKEMHIIGDTVSKLWQKTYGKLYDSQCSTNATIHIEKHPLTELKTNDENYNKALSAALTIGGWDFSADVKENLHCYDKDVKKLSNLIDEGKSQEDIQAYCQTIDKFNLLTIKQSIISNQSAQSHYTERLMAATILNNDEYKHYKTFISDDELHSDYKEILMLTASDFPYNNIKELINQLYKNNIDESIKVLQTYSNTYKELNAKQNNPKIEEFCQKADKLLKKLTERQKTEQLYQQIYDELSQKNNLKPYNSRDVAFEIEMQKENPLKPMSIRDIDFSKPFLKDYYIMLQNGEIKKIKKHIQNIKKATGVQENVEKTNTFQPLSSSLFITRNKDHTH